MGRGSETQLQVGVNLNKITYIILSNYGRILSVQVLDSTRIQITIVNEMK